MERINQNLSEIIRVYPSKSKFIQVNQNKSEFIRIKREKILNRLGFLILSILKNSEATNRVSSMTVKEIASVEDFGWKENTIFKKIKEFERSGYIERGLKEGRAATFFITQNGIDYLDGERGKQ